MKKFTLFFVLCSLFVFNSLFVIAQKPKQLNASEIKLALKKLNVLGNVLYMAAHPDDENTRLITYLANKELVNTAYLSLTRGDGGQNLVGAEIREQLGIIRTQELLQARRKDGGQQYFSRANDFGYSKSDEETLTIWGKEAVLSDAVWVIRKFKPDVIITRFPPDSRAGHGHHTASAIIAMEAFDKAADPDVFPEQLNYVDVWQPKSIFINTGRWWKKDISKETQGVYTVDVGEFNQLLGKSYSEIAAESRSMHKSQGFGATGSRGELTEYLEFVKGERPEETPFDNIDFSWNRLGKVGAQQQIIARLIEQFDVEKPVASIPDLINLHKSLEELQDDFWKDKKQAEVKNLIVNCLGLYLEIKATDYYAAPGTNIKLDVEMISRENLEVKVNNFQLEGTDNLIIINKNLEENIRLNHSLDITIPQNFSASDPYWLKEDGSFGLFNVSDQKMIGLPENKPALIADFKLTIDKQAFNFKVPVIYKWNDPVHGEQYRPFIIMPPVTVTATESVMIFAEDDQKEFDVKVMAGRDSINAELKLDMPKGWSSVPDYYPVELVNKGDEQSFNFKIVPPAKSGIGYVSPYIKLEGHRFNNGLKTIKYDHIPTQTIFPVSKTKLVKLDINKYGNKIGYIMGAGDDIPKSLEQSGYEVDLLEENDITLVNLRKYDAVILGIRALNTNQRMKFYQNDLLQFVSEGGNMIVQYNTNFRMVTNDFAPYPIKISRDRVAEEDAKVKFLNSSHEVLSYPNKITEEDFENWVQERGLYFPNEWSEEYEAIISWQDKGETPKDGSLLIAKYGQGYYIYSGISFFRQLPAGVPGAYRLFTNMISLGKNKNEIK